MSVASNAMRHTDIHHCNIGANAKNGVVKHISSLSVAPKGEKKEDKNRSCTVTDVVLLTCVMSFFISKILLFYMGITCSTLIDVSCDSLAPFFV